MSKKTIAERFEKAGLEKDRFVTARDGQKECFDHDTRYDDPRDVPGENYAIYSDEDDQLLALDVDVHRGGDSEEYDSRAVAGLGRFGMTLTIKSPHASDEIGGHRILKLEGEETPAELFDRVFGRKNPVPSWGEVISKNKYIIGAGSVLDGCSKDWCDRCEDDDGGQYTIRHDAEIQSVEPEELIEALAIDDDLERKDEAGDDDQDPDLTGDEDLTREDVEELLDAIGGRQHFDDWVTTGYAVLAWDDGEEGKEVFEEWSSSNAKWEKEESQRQIDYIWNQGDASDDDDNAGVGTLIYKARQHGYDGDIGSSYTPESSESDEVAPLSWGGVRQRYARAQKEEEYTKGNARLAATKVLENLTSWMHVLESEVLWVYDGDSGQYGEYGKAYARQILESELGEFYAKHEAEEIIARIKARNQVRRKVLNAREYDDPLVCVGNGVVNLQCGELLDHSPEYRFVRGLDVDYEPALADPEKVLTFLDEVTAREADRDTLLDHLAHGLMPGHPYRAFVVCYGPGGNGKTQVAELFRGFVGSESAAAVEIDELAEGDFATGDLPGTFINWGDDMAGDGGGQLSDLSLLKKATGGSEIRSNEKWKNIFNFKNEAAMFFSANEPPRIGEQKASIQDRIYPIEMPYRFKSDPDEDNPMEKQKTPNVSKTLLEDDAAMKGMLLLAVKHAQELIESRGEYSQPESPEERLEKYNQSADPIVKFAGRALEEAAPEFKIRKDDAHRVFRGFAESWEERIASERGFKRQLPGAIASEIETARSRELASPDDGEDRVRCWKRVKWTETARQHMPEWMEKRYSEHFEDVSSADTETGSDEEAPLAARDPQYAATLRVTVQTVNDGEYSRKAQGRLKGPKDTYIGYIVPGGADLEIDVYEGKEVLLDGVTIRTDDDDLREAVIDDAVEISATQDEGEDTDTDPSPDATSAGTQQSATPDGGVVQTKERVQNILAARELDDNFTASAVAGRLGESPHAVESVLVDLCNQPEPLITRVDTEEGRFRYL